MSSSPPKRPKTGASSPAVKRVTRVRSVPAEKPEARRGGGFPWGLVVVLVLYFAGVGLYVWSNYYDSPEYKAAQAYGGALRLLGVDDGRKCSEAELNRAFELTMQAANRLPEERMLIDHLERLRHRFEERKFKLGQDRVNAVEMMASRTLRIEQQRASVLVIGSRDRGWAPDQLLAGPERAVLWSLPGAAFIIVFWAYTRFSRKAAEAREHEEKLKAREREVEELGHFRRRIGPDGRPMPQPGEEEEATDTIASPQPVKVRPENIVARPSRVGTAPARATSTRRAPVRRDDDED